MTPSMISTSLGRRLAGGGRLRTVAAAVVVVTFLGTGLPLALGDEPSPRRPLVIGTIFPSTGDLAYHHPAHVAAAELAVIDINAAGGVLGQPVELELGDSGDLTTGIAVNEADRLIDLGAGVIVGAVSSAVSMTVIDRITGAGVVQISAGNTSPELTTYDDGDLYFRTTPSDLLQGQVLAGVVADQGNRTVSVMFRDETYGRGLAGTFRTHFERAGGRVDEFVPYPVDADTFTVEVDRLVAAGSDAVIIIGFAESSNILTTMHERGIGPTSKTNVWGTDGNADIDTEMTNPEILRGMRQTHPSINIGWIPDFITRLQARIPPDSTLLYSAETYDAVVIAALAAEKAGRADGAAIAAEINGITSGGTTCTTFRVCKRLIEEGIDPDYDGLGGPYEFSEAGEPTQASILIRTYGFDGPMRAQDRYVYVG